ncbi:transcription termination factor MTEF1, chloroplastic [Dioscorea cayenensis subsp. rotundata]|uniref:Transcription termination factor MTEF1, chloroplastic n=1 Tax=Dioscorea cayennensis subsp. rotundata TaxID=55577 RepID=A0AB40AKC2_DIOCR|nr:transcription termination factor MTEF1, chloroplastic [Dioscorea cayenensis subsp. rotundata]
MAMVRLHLQPPFSSKPLPNPNPSPLPSSEILTSTSDAGLLFREKLLYLQRDLHIDASRALAANPALRSAPLPSLRAASDVLLSHGFLPDDASRILSHHPSLLTSDPEDPLIAALRFLRGPVGIPLSHLRRTVLRCPRLLVTSVPNQLQPTLYFLRRFGFVGSHRITSQTALLLVSSVEKTLIPKLDFIQSLGFSYKETQKMVLRSPGLLTFSIENNFKPKWDFLVNEMGRDLKELKEFPQYFAFSLEGRIKPRQQMLVESGLSMPLADMLKLSDGAFREQLIDLRIASLDKRL